MEKHRIAMRTGTQLGIPVMQFHSCGTSRYEIIFIIVNGAMMENRRMPSLKLGDGREIFSKSSRRTRFEF